MKFSFTTTASLLVLLILIGSAYVYLTNAERRSTFQATYSTTTQVVTCASDTKICPEGTVLGRTGSTCQFPDCPRAASATSTTSSKTVMLRGQVIISPTCPVEKNPPDPACEPKGYMTDVTAYTPDGEPASGRVTTTATGTFTLRLLPGTYTIKAASGQVYPRCTHATVILKQDTPLTITINCDSGIR